MEEADDVEAEGFGFSTGFREVRCIGLVTVRDVWLPTVVAAAGVIAAATNIAADVCLAETKCREAKNMVTSGVR
ncbi:hypothetical protein AAVH_34783 [Aphelenchoides avenae]|nr:hypothetical protein AAVH_34783 [Aphelenchus avenae]